MEFTNFIDARSFLLWSAFGVALIMGAVVNKTNFCTMGAVSDWVNMGDLGRMRAWFFAIAIAMLGVVLLESFGMVSPDKAFPPYRASTLIWGENVIGGLMFGIGMTLASGCGNKTLIRIGGGNIKSIFVALVIAIIAYYMIFPFPGTDKTLFSELFLPWTRALNDASEAVSPLTVALTTQQDLGTMVAGKESAVTARLVIGGVIGLALMFVVWKSKEFRSSFDNILGGLVVGLAVLLAWYFSSNISINLDGTSHTLASYAQEWDFLAESEEGKPAEIRSLSPQSYTFINPMGQVFGLAKAGFDSAYLTFGIMAVFGVIAGSLLWSLITRSFRIEWFANRQDFLNHLVGAILMGFGGVLAMGCTIGQAVTGASTLALGSFLAFGSIVLGSALTMKIQYYKMVYEDEATFGKALLTGLVDLKLLPSSLRKLDAI
ncbi:MAG: YeeE/YedE family protein [Gammaproteobacteria bacterium]|nr:YeeE/YedE family protein [Gammaproteobacteria bacterium]